MKKKLLEMVHLTVHVFRPYLFIFSFSDFIKEKKKSGTVTEPFPTTFVSYIFLGH